LNNGVSPEKYSDTVYTIYGGNRLLESSLLRSTHTFTGEKEMEQIACLKEKLTRYEEVLVEIERLVFCHPQIPVSVRGAIQELIIIKAGINPPPRDH
jgi:hypothetical protein